MSDTPRDCEHGQLYRSCEICELKRELAAERERADRLIAFLADDALAITYQSLAQYRQAAIDAARRK